MALIRVANTSNGHCAARAISTMRLALGHRIGLPQSEIWMADAERITISDLVAALPGAFPRRKILVWFDRAPDEPTLLTEMFWCGPVVTPEQMQMYQDAYLFAFVYVAGKTAGGDIQGHIVIGTPIVELSAPLVFAVSFAKTRSRS